MFNYNTATEIEKLEYLLTKANIPYEEVDHFTSMTPMVCYPNYKNCICDAVCHDFSYGHELGLLEIMGLVDDDLDDEVQGFLTAEQVFEKMKAHYESMKGGK